MILNEDLFEEIPKKTYKKREPKVTYNSFCDTVEKELKLGNEPVKYRIDANNDTKYNLRVTTIVVRTKNKDQKFVNTYVPITKEELIKPLTDYLDKIGFDYKIKQHYDKSFEIIIEFPTERELEEAFGDESEYGHDDYDDFEEEEIIDEPEETTHPKNAVKYYIRVNNTDSGVAEVYGKIKEFEDGTKIGIHTEDTGEKVATDIRTGYKIIGTHSPIYKGDELVEPKKKNAELFDQAYELIKSINQEYYNNIPDVKSFIQETKIEEEPTITTPVDDITESLNEELSPKQEIEYALVTLTNSLIKDELEAIDGYNSAIVNFEAEGKGEYTDVIRDIISEENKHIGQLQAILQDLNVKTTSDIDEGQQEGEEQIADAVNTTEEEVSEGETKTTIDTENGEIKTFKLDKVERIKDTELEDSALQG